MTRIFYDDILFRKVFPDFDGMTLSFLKLQWNIAGQYIAKQPQIFPLQGVQTYIQLTAHLAQLNLMAQKGARVNGKTDPVITAPSGASEFKRWLQQTTYGQMLCAS